MKNYLKKNQLLLITSLIFSAIFSVGSALVALILQEVIDIAISGDLKAFYTIIIQASVFLLGLGLCYYLCSRSSKKFIYHVLQNIRHDVFHGLLKRNLSDFNSVNSADYLSALTNDIKMIEENYLNPLFLIIQHIILFIASFAIMVYLSPIVTICLVITTILMIIIPALFQKRLQDRQDQYSGKLSAFTVKARDLLSGFDVVRSFRMHRYAEDTFQESSHDLARAKYAVDSLYALVEALSSTLGSVVQSGVLFLSAWLIIKGSITAGTLVALVQISGCIAIPIQAISENLPKMKSIQPVTTRMNQFSDYEDQTFTGTETPSFEDSIRISDLSFGYAGSGEVLHDIDVTFEKGKKYAITGKSGCGKSTLMHMISGHYAEYKGSISYDGTELKSLDNEKLAELISVVHQDVYMFDETIGDNICLHQICPDADLERALKLSGTSLFLDEEKSLNAPVGENGTLLSGGQKQRIAVARALTGRKPILILDEGTSAIDQPTAVDIENRLHQAEDLTLFTITHTMDEASLRKYDAIIYMEDGRIKQMGDFDQLIQPESAFFTYFYRKN